MDIIEAIDAEIAKLQQAHAALVEAPLTTTKAKTPGKTRNLTPEGRRRIAEAVKRRWANQRKNKAA